MIPALLKKQLSAGTFPHAYLFSGSDEDSKNEALEFISEQILGKEWKRSLDYMEIAGELITIDDIHDMKSRAYSAPISGEKNIFVIKNMETLSREASPALLKILEDPPKSALILATTGNQKLLLPTIRSRFSILRFYKKEQIAGSITAKSVEKISEILKYLEGKVRSTPDASGIKRFEEALWVRRVLTDKTVNKRLLNEYLTMIIPS